MVTPLVVHSNLITMWLKLIVAVLIWSGLGGECLGAVSGNGYDGNQLARGFDAKNVLTSIATSLMSRGYGTTGMGSQVVSLNLTNLLILVLLKAIIFAAASLAVHKGGAGGEHYARTVDGEEPTTGKLLSDEEILMFLSYLTGTPGNNGCLQNVACHQPDQAKKYVNAGDVVLKAAKMFSYPTDDTYDYVIKEVDQAANVGLAGGNCEIFKCNSTANI